MPAEYKTFRLSVEHPFDGADTFLNTMAGEGWTVKAAYSPTHFLLERLPPAMVQRAEPKPPTGPGGRG